MTLPLLPQGPVFRVRWSPFVSDVFVSCSADWSVKLWHQDHTAPLHSFSNTQVQPLASVQVSPKQPAPDVSVSVSVSESCV